MTRNKLTPAKAWAHFRKMPADTRSINALHAELKAQGHAIARKTLTKWADEAGWNGKVAGIDAAIAKDPALVEAQDVALEVKKRAELGDLPTDPNDLIALCTMMAAGLGKTLLAVLPDITTMEVADVRTLATTTLDVVKALHELNGGTKPAEAAAAGPMGGMSLDDLARVLEARQKAGA